MDIYKLSNGRESFGKAGLNTIVGAWGLTSFGVPASILYSGMEAFYPGGTLGAMKDYSDVQKIYRENNNGVVLKPSL